MHYRILMSELLVVFATVALAVFLPIHFSNIGLSVFEIGLAFSILSLVASIVGFGVGILEERISTYKLLAASYGGYILLPIVYFSARNFTHLMCATIYDGITTAFRVGPLYSIFEGRSAKKTTLGISHLETGINLAAFAGPIAGGIVLSMYGTDMYFLAVWVVLLSAFLLYPKNFGNLKHKASIKKIFSELKFLKSDPLLHVLLAIMFMISFVQFSNIMVMPLFMNHLGHSVESIGLIGGLFFIFLAAGEFIAGYIETARTRGLLFSLGLIIAAISIFLFSVFHTELWQFVVIALLFSLGIGLVRPALFSFVVSDHPSYRYFTTGVLLTFSRLGIFVGLLLAGILISLDFSYYFILCGVVLFSAFLLSWFVKHVHLPKKHLKKHFAHD